MACRGAWRAREGILRQSRKQPSFFIVLYVPEALSAFLDAASIALHFYRSLQSTIPQSSLLRIKAHEAFWLLYVDRSEKSLARGRMSYT